MGANDADRENITIICMIGLTIETYVLLFKFVGTKEVVEAAKVIVEARVT